MATVRATARRPTSNRHDGGAWVVPWRGSSSTAQLVVGRDARPPDDVVRDCLDEARTAGYRSILTSTLKPADADPFLAAGFAVWKRLHLLVHELREQPDLPSARLERGTRRQHAEVVALDAAAFDRFWQLGSQGLRDTLSATPTSRFRVARDAEPIAGYAITGRAGIHGYLQRLAVHPAARRSGWGRALVADGLRWLWEHAVTQAFVNTQVGNAGALALYESVGFERLPSGLCVLGRPL